SIVTLTWYSLVFSHLTPLPPISTLLPYTTLFRSGRAPPAGVLRRPEPGSVAVQRLLGHGQDELTPGPQGARCQLLGGQGVEARLEHRRSHQLDLAEQLAERVERAERVHAQLGVALGVDGHALPVLEVDDLHVGRGDDDDVAGAERLREAGRHPLLHEHLAALELRGVLADDVDVAGDVLGHLV